MRWKKEVELLVEETEARWEERLIEVTGGEAGRWEMRVGVKGES